MSYGTNIPLGAPMTLYALQDWRPELPAAGEFWIAPNASLIGRVRLLKGASIWFGSVLRGDNDWITVGERCNIQDLCIVHADPGMPVVLGANVSIGHGVVLHGAIVGDNTIIGMGATLLNRAKIGRNSIVGADAHVGFRSKVEPGGFAARSVDDEKRVGLAKLLNQPVAHRIYRLIGRDNP